MASWAGFKASNVNSWLTRLVPGRDLKMGCCLVPGFLCSASSEASRAVPSDCLRRAPGARNKTIRTLFYFPVPVKNLIEKGAGVLSLGEGNTEGDTLVMGIVLGLSA